MTAATRRVLKMLVRVLAWIGAHPDDDPGFQVLVSRLQAVVTRMTQVIDDQRLGRITTRGARVRKEQLRQLMLQGPIANLGRIGALVGSEASELKVSFSFRPTADSALAFLRAARTMFASAQSRQEVLMQHGLSVSVLTQFGEWLDEYERTMAAGAGARALHTAATRELEALTKEGGAIVRAMDAHARLRFQQDRQAAEQWISTRTVLGVPERGKDEETGLYTHALPPWDTRCPPYQPRPPAWHCRGRGQELQPAPHESIGDYSDRLPRMCPGSRLIMFHICESSCTLGST